MNATSLLDFGSPNFNFTNCSSAVSIWLYLQPVVDTDMIAPNDDYRDPHKIYEYIIEGLDGYLQHNSIQKPPMTDEFWAWARRGGLDQTAAEYAYETCVQTLCRAVGWKGNPDMVGIGMLVTYLMQQLLISIYLYPIVRIRLGIKPNRTDRKSFISRTLLAIRLSTTAFLSASAVFSIALLLASNITMAQQESTSVLATFVLSAVVPLNSVFPIIILQLATPGTFRRQKGRLMLWGVIDVLILVLVIRGILVLMMTAAEDSMRIGGDPIGQKACVDMEFVPWVYLCWATAALLVIGLTVFVVGSLLSVLRHRQSVFVRLPSWTSWIILFVSFFAMLFFNIWLVYLTIRIRSRAGAHNKDSEWTFGQILALATWVPFLAEFAYTWLEESEDALNGRLPAPYEVVVASTVDDAFGTARPGIEQARGQFQRLAATDLPSFESSKASTWPFNTH